MLHNKLQTIGLMWLKVLKKEKKLFIFKAAILELDLGYVHTAGSDAKIVIDAKLQYFAEFRFFGCGAHTNK